MIEMGTVSDVTAPMMTAKLTPLIVEHGGAAVFVDGERNVRLLAHHAADFDGMVTRRAQDLVGVYFAPMEYERGKRHDWSLVEDLRQRIEEIYATMSVGN